VTDWEVACSVCGTLIPGDRVTSYKNRKGESRVRWRCVSCGATGYEVVAGDKGEKDNDGTIQD
jgi:RNase P subunit RPR2